MKEKRAIYLYNAISSFISYENFLEEAGANTKYLKNVDFDILTSVYASLTFVKDIDKYIEKKDNDDGKILLSSKVVQDIACLLSEKTTNGYRVGGLGYKSADDLLIKIRNKLAHGDFFVEDGQIVFDENNLTAKISIDNLVDASKALKFHAETSSLYMPYKRTYIDIDGNNYISTKDFLSFATYAENIKILTVSSEVKSGHKRTEKDVAFYENLLCDLEPFFGRHGINEQSVAYVNEYISKHAVNSNVNLNLSIKTLKNASYYEAVKTYYENEKDFIDSLPANVQIRYLSDVILKKSKPNKNYNISVGLLLNLEYIQNLKSNKDLSFKDFVKSEPVAAFNIDTMLAANLIAGFYAIYQLGLEDGFTNHTVYDVDNLLNGQNLDFSLLNTVCASSKINNPEFKNQHDVLMKQNCLIAKQEERLNRSKNNLKKYQEINENGKLDENVLKKLEDFINAAQKELDEAKNYKFLMLRYFLGMNREHFAENFGNITSIRNSITHSNEELIDNGEPLAKKKLCFKDIYDGKCCYSKTVTVGEFKELFNYKNMIVLMEYLKYNITDKSKINENILEEIYNEQLKRTKTLYGN